MSCYFYIDPHIYILSKIFKKTEQICKQNLPDFIRITFDGKVIMSLPLLSPDSDRYRNVSHLITFRQQSFSSNVQNVLAYSQQGICHVEQDWILNLTVIHGRYRGMTKFIYHESFKDVPFYRLGIIIRNDVWPFIHVNRLKVPAAFMHFVTLFCSRMTLAMSQRLPWCGYTTLIRVHGNIK